MKNSQKLRMYKGKKKSASEGESKPSGRKQTDKSRTVKKGGAGHHDDDSVDSRGNIRGLIAYSSSDEEWSATSESEMDYDTDSSVGSAESRLTPEQKATIRRSARKAALKAKKRIHDRLKKEEEAERKKKKSRSLATAATSSSAAAKKSKKRKEEESTEEEVEEEETTEEEDVEEEEDDYSVEDDDEEEEEDDEEDDEEAGGRGGISISIGAFDDSAFLQRLKPRRHNMKKEPESVQKFVKLITAVPEENTIDDQIDQFKNLTEEKQTQLIQALERKPSSSDPSQNLMFKILTMKLPQETQTLVLAKYNSLQGLDPSSGEYFKLRAWLEKLTSLPLGQYKEMPVKMDDGTEKCGSFMENARKCLDAAIYGQEEAKIQILQFIASKIANPTARGLSLLLAGPPGIGKTSLIRNGIAKALSWPFQFISLGGDSDASTYTGHQLVYESSHSGKIVNALAAAKSMSMILMFDEVDKISTTPKGEEVMNLLIHLTDPVQNEDFEDKYLSGVPIDLSRVMFAFSGNDLNKVDKVLLDRMIVVNLQGYSAKEKLNIAENFIVPAALAEVNLSEKVSISKEVIQYVIEEYAKEEAGVRELKRCIEQIAQKVNVLRIFNNKDLPFHIPDFHLPFVVKKDHVNLFLKKKQPAMDISVQRMYT